MQPDAVVTRLLDSTRIETWPGGHRIVWLGDDGMETVQELHRCNEWEVLRRGYRCGLTFGDGHRCDQALMMLSDSWSQWTYVRPRSPDAA